MRLLIYGMQSSGASSLAYVLAQKSECAAFIDIWTLYAAPALADDGGDGDVVAKVVVTTAFPLSLHQERFRPDRTILFLRHPEANYLSLATKQYRHHCGFLEEKFALLDDVFMRNRGVDAIMYYEDWVFDPLGTLDSITGLGWSCDRSFLKFKRKPAEIKSFNEIRYPSVVGRLQYDVGNYHPGSVTNQYADLPDITKSTRRLCPAVSSHYD
jgi:hypothetical protein